MATVDQELTEKELARDYALTSRMNEIYYAGKIAYWRRWDTGFKITSAFASSAAVVFFLKDTAPHGTVIASCLSAAAAVSTILSTVLNLTESIRAFAVLRAEYALHFATFSKMKRFGCTLDEVKAAIDKFDETAQREAKDDPTTSDKLLEAAYRKALEENALPA